MTIRTRLSVSYWNVKDNICREWYSGKEKYEIRENECVGSPHG